MRSQPSRRQLYSKQAAYQMAGRSLDPHPFAPEFPEHQATAEHQPARSSKISSRSMIPDQRARLWPNVRSTGPPKFVETSQDPASELPQAGSDLSHLSRHPPAPFALSPSLGAPPQSEAQAPHQPHVRPEWRPLPVGRPRAPGRGRKVPERLPGFPKTPAGSEAPRPRFDRNLPR